MANPETIIKNKILLALGRVAGVFWNHPTGTARAYDAPERVIKYGLPGSPDIIGVTPITVTAEMVGRKIGVAIGVEVKTATGRQREQQKKFQSAFTDAGGVYILARSVDDAITQLETVTAGGDL